jgi:energy-coupling factor transport system substrate-specific component
MSFDWLHVCSSTETTPCVQTIQVAYLAALLIGVAIFAVAAARSRHLGTATLTLIPVAIAINIAVGSIVSYLHLPIYLDSIGTVLVGVLCGPLAGALTGLLANLVWSILPLPGGGGPTIAFFAPVAGVIGLMAGFWGGRGVFRLRAGDERVGSFLALATGVVAAAAALLVVQQSLGIPNVGGTADDQNRFVVMSVAIAVFAVVVAVVSRRTIFAFRPDDSRIVPSLVVATAAAAGVIVFAVLRLLFSPSGYFSTVNGDPNVLNGANLTGLAIADPAAMIAALIVAVAAALGAGYWASHGENARLFPVWIGGLTTGLVAAAMSAPIAAGVFGGVTGAGTDALVALFRTLGLNVFQSAFAQGLTSDPLDKTISYTVVFLILSALPVTVRTMFVRGEDTVAE